MDGTTGAPGAERTSAQARSRAARLAGSCTLAATSVAVLGLAGAATYADPGRRWVRLSVAAQPDALPSWWATVLYAFVALACLVRTQHEVELRRGRRHRVVVPLAWAALAGLLSVLSADRVLGLHRLLADDERLTALPAAVAGHPVQVVLLAVGLPVVGVLLATTSRAERLLLVVGGASYLVAGVVLDQRLVQPSWNFARVETAELALEWTGALLLMVAASLRASGSSSAGRAGGRVPASLPLPQHADAQAPPGAAARRPEDRVPAAGSAPRPRA